MGVLLLVAALAAACGGGGDDSSAPTTTPVTEAPSTTTPPTTAAPVSTLPGTPRITTTLPVSLGPGDAALAGTVTGPSGPVPGAVVRVERLVSRTPAVADVRTGDGGSWSIEGILGGPYRVRAFRTPDLGQVLPETFFLAAGERRTVTLSLALIGQNTITATLEPNPPVVDQPAALTVRVGNGRVDGEGTVAVDPTPAARLQLSLTDGLSLESTSSQLTDGDGRATWQIRCRTTGAFQAFLSVGGGLTSFTLPACVPGPAPPG